MIMKLNDEPFELMASGKKIIEVRCADPKRRELKIGDEAVFVKISDPEKIIRTEVADLRFFPTFLELYSAYPSSMFGYEDKTAEELAASVDGIYEKEKQEKYGALAITVKVKGTEI